MQSLTAVCSVCTCTVHRKYHQCCQIVHIALRNGALSLCIHTRNSDHQLKIPFVFSAVNEALLFIQKLISTLQFDSHGKFLLYLIFQVLTAVLLRVRVF